MKVTTVNAQRKSFLLRNSMFKTNPKALCKISKKLIFRLVKTFISKNKHQILTSKIHLNGFKYSQLIELSLQNYTKEYSGRNCEGDYNECTSATSELLCLNNGTCVNQSPGYSCNCIPEFYGTQCETSYDDCSEDFTICRNGICIDKARNETDVPAFRYFLLNLQ